MKRMVSGACGAIVMILTLGVLSTPAQESPGCEQFRADVSHELALRQGNPETVSAATSVKSAAPTLKLDKLYAIKLSPQVSVSFAVKPGKGAMPATGAGGMAHFHVEKDGRYRIAINTGHWIDVVEGASLIKSVDYQGAHGCARMHKIVEFELPAHKELLLQLSGSTDPVVLTTITAVSATAAH